MILDIFLFLVGLAVLVAGGEALIRGACSLAAAAGISPLVIGLTAVAFGTSAPELVVSVMAALQGSTEITFGNVVGSNIANIGLLLGLTAVIRSLKVESTIITREIPMMLLACASVAALGLDSFLGGTHDLVTRGDGLMLLLLFGVFLYYTIRDVIRPKHTGDALLSDVAESRESAPQLSKKVAIGLIILGVLGLFGGGKLSVDSAMVIARALGVPEVVIGATLVAVGTSLPELVTCIQAARRGMTDLVIGNIVGSNIFNVLFVLSTTAVIYPVPIPANGWVDIGIMLVLSVMLLRVSVTDEQSITRREGALLLFSYGAFLAWQLLR